MIDFLTLLFARKFQMATDNGNFFADGLLKLFFAIFKAVGVRQVKAGLRPVTTFSAIETPTISVAGQQRNIKPTMSDADRLVFEVLSDPPESESIGENIFKANSSYTTSLPLTTTYAEDSNVTFTQDLKWLNLADSTSFSNRTTSEPQYPVIVAYHSASFTHVIIGISVGIATAVLIVAGANSLKHFLSLDNSFSYITRFFNILALKEKEEESW